ncbi:uncharacterized protein O8D03_014013 [Erethizon dorsatum]
MLPGKILQNHMQGLHIGSSKLFWRALATLQVAPEKERVPCPLLVTRLSEYFPDSTPCCAPSGARRGAGGGRAGRRARGGGGELVAPRDCPCWDTADPASRAYSDLRNEAKRLVREARVRRGGAGGSALPSPGRRLEVALALPCPVLAAPRVPATRPVQTRAGADGGPLPPGPFPPGPRGDGVEGALFGARTRGPAAEKSPARSTRGAAGAVTGARTSVGPASLRAEFLFFTLPPWVSDQLPPTPPPPPPQCALRVAPLSCILQERFFLTTVQEQTVPVPVKKSWAMLNYLVKVPGGVSELEDPQTHLSTLIHQSTEQNINNKSPDLASFQLHVDTGVESGLNRTETKISQSLISRKQLQYGNDLQILRSKSLATSVGAPPPRHLGGNITQEEAALLKKDSKYVPDLSTGQSAIDIPEKRIQQRYTQVTNKELTPRLPYKGTDNIKITPLALLQVMDAKGLIPESHSEMTESVDLLPQAPNQVVKPMKVMETVHVTPKPPNRVTESMEVTPKTQQQVVEPNRMASGLNQVIGNVKMTPVALLQVMDSKRMINESHPYITEPVGMTPRPQYQAMESVDMNTLLDTMMMPQHTVMEAVEVAPGPKHKVG